MFRFVKKLSLEYTITKSIKTISKLKQWKTAEDQLKTE